LEQAVREYGERIFALTLLENHRVADVDALRRRLGQRHPLVINHKSVSTPDWRPSLNPANQQEVIG
jgi:hypothetical protein